MPYNANVEIVLRGIQGGQICVNEFEYHRETPVTGITAEQLAGWAVFTLWPEIRDRVCDSYVLLEVEARITQVGASPLTDTHISVVNEAGLLAVDALPPNVTLVMIKEVDNTTIDPPLATPFRNGFCGFSGIPEASQTNGLLTSFAQTDWSNVATLLESFSVDVGGSPYEFVLGLERPDPSNDKVLVSDVRVRQKVGTRNSRKR